MNAHTNDTPQGAPIGDDAVLAEGASWDIDTAARDARERALAWRVVTLLAVLLAGWGVGSTLAIVQLSAKLAAKQAPVPHVWFLDEETGMPTRLTRLSDMEFPAREATVKADLADYVIRRERYNWETIQTDYDAVSLWSSDTVGRAYASMYDAKNGRQVVLGESTTVDVEITSVPRLDGEGRATVRFVQIARRDGRVIGEDHFIATIGFRYDPKAALEDADRLVDPRSLEVTAYTVQEDMSR